MLARNPFRWLRVKCVEIVGRRVAVEAAPGASAEAEKTVVVERKAEGSAYPAEALSAARDVQVGRSFLARTAGIAAMTVARAMVMGRMVLDAYKVAAFTVFRKLTMGGAADAETAPGADEEALRAAQIRTAANAMSADAEVTGANKEVATASGVRAAAPFGRDADGRKIVVMGAGSKVEPALAAAAKIKPALVMASAAIPYTWIDPELLEDGTLLIRQVYEIALVDGALEVS